MDREYRKTDGYTSLQLRPDAARATHDAYVQREVVRKCRVSKSHAKVIAELQGYHA